MLVLLGYAYRRSYSSYATSTQLHKKHKTLHRPMKREKRNKEKTKAGQAIKKAETIQNSIPDRTSSLNREKQAR